MGDTNQENQEAIYNYSDILNKIKTLSVEQLEALSFEIDALIWDNYHVDKCNQQRGEDEKTNDNEK